MNLVRTCLLLVTGLASGAVPLPAQTADSSPPVSQLPGEMQPRQLPALPTGMTVEMLIRGDSIFHGRGGCFACHGAEAQGLPDAGNGLTYGLTYVAEDWDAIDSIIRHGIPDPLTRSDLAMPDRGARGDLTPAAMRAVSAYVWAISQVEGEPWPGGHDNHPDQALAGLGTGASPAAPLAASGGARGMAREVRNDEDSASSSDLGFPSGDQTEPGGTAAVWLTWALIVLSVALVVGLNLWFFRRWQNAKREKARRTT